MTKIISNSGKNKEGVGIKILSWMIADEMKLMEHYQMYVVVFGIDDTIQLSLAEQKSHEELEAKQNKEKVKENLMAEEIKKLVKGMENIEENVEVDRSTIRKNNNQNDLGTRSTMIWERIHDFHLVMESYQQKVNLTAPTITFPGSEKYEVFFIVSEPVYGIIHENSKKENTVMRHQEIHNFLDATLKRVLEGLKSYNNEVKHGYVNLSLSKEDVEYLQVF
nr:hypothetical protein [Tanacetum cinerariifolium]